MLKELYDALDENMAELESLRSSDTYRIADLLSARNEIQKTIIKLQIVEIKELLKKVG